MESIKTHTKTHGSTQKWHSPSPQKKGQQNHISIIEKELELAGEQIASLKFFPDGDGFPLPE